MWLPDQTLREIDRVARFRYIGKHECMSWNEHRRDGELRLLSGWEWLERGGQGRHQQGLKTLTAAYRDAFYVLIRKEAAPKIPTTIKIVAQKKEEAA
jgi:hypothetical protein